MTFSSNPLLAAAATAWLALGCSTSGSTEVDCSDGKCDDPGSTATAECRAECGGDQACFQQCRDSAAIGHCEARRADALDSAQRAFTADAIRWACADVEGVNTNNRDDRGQEYCEYYAVVQPPPAVEGGELPPIATPGRNRARTEGGGVDPLSLELTEDQIFALEDHPDTIVGQCIFTSWHSDIGVSLPVCEDGACPNLALADDAALPPWADGHRELRVPLDARYMQMKVGINSNNAAADLFEKCLGGPPSREYDADLDDHYMRGCMKTYELFETEWRRSDPSVCVVGARLRECNCGIDANGNGVLDEGDITDIEAISRAVVPFQPDSDGTLRLRGFHLGTWSDKNALPPGCSYVETGDADSTRTLVACDLTAADLLSNANDVKGRCRDKYGDNVVVHVPGHLRIQDAVVCDPDPNAPHTADCGNLPWVVGAEDSLRDPNPVSCVYDVCSTHDVGPSNDCNTCTQAVCTADPACCDTWDELCVARVAESCADSFSCK